MASNSTLCIDNTLSSIYFNTFSPNVGEIWSATNDLTTRGINYCYEITTLIDNPGSIFSAQTLYATCDDCLRNNYGVIRISDCIRGTEYIVTYDSFIGEPIIGEVFNGTISSVGGRLISSCFTIDYIGQFSENEFDYATSLGKLGTITTLTTVYTGCTDCLTGSTVSYEVNRCTDGIIDCVGLIGLESALVGHVISYSNGVDLYCGEVGKPTSDFCPIIYTFISDFGIGEEGLCDECLSSGNTRLLLTDCLRPEITEVVWASALFNNGEVSSLSTDLGCFTVVGPTGETVTINYYLNFDPTPTCQACIECNGFTIRWKSCEDEFIIGSTTSYQYVNLGNILYHPLYGCIEVTGVSPGDNGSDYVYGFETFITCPDCQVNANRTLYVATACTSATTYVFNVSVPATASPGDTYQLSWGSVPFICVTLTEPVGEGLETGEYFTSDADITCEECSSSNIGVRAINCSTGQYSVFNLTQEDYVRHYYSKPREFYVFKTNGECYFIANPCPQQPTGITPTITNYYDICFECTPDPLPPISAGTEYNVCVIDCSGNTITIRPPHPTWTNEQGRAVVLLDAIVLGGMNGLNN